MSVATSVDFQVTPPALMFSHFGINCDDADKLEDFYTRVLGFCVSDHGMTRQETIRIVFMTRRPREHHQFVLASGRSSEHAPTVGETGFKAPDLAALRQRELGPLWLLGTAFSIALTAFFVFIKRFVDETGIGSVGLFFTAYSGAALALRAGNPDPRQYRWARSSEGRLALSDLPTCQAGLGDSL